MSPLQLCRSRTSPGVLGSSSLSLPLWVPLQCPLDYMSIWSPQRVANPTPSSSSYLLLYRSLPCLSALLLICLGHQILKMFLRCLLVKTCNFCSNPLVSLQVCEPYKSTAFTFDPKNLSLVLVVSAVDRHIGTNTANAFSPFQFVPESPRQSHPSCLQCSQGM